MSDPAPSARPTSPGAISSRPLREVAAYGLASIVERSTTAAGWMDGLETGWTEPHVRGPAGPKRTKTLTLPR